MCSPPSSPPARRRSFRRRRCRAAPATTPPCFRRRGCPPACSSCATRTAPTTRTRRWRSTTCSAAPACSSARRRRWRGVEPSGATCGLRFCPDRMTITQRGDHPGGVRFVRLLPVITVVALAPPARRRGVAQAEAAFDDAVTEALAQGGDGGLPAFLADHLAIGEIAVIGE